jgi:PIN domain nuclease of toxin-antitoxin system
LKLLIDTNIFLFALLRTERLEKKTLELITDPDVPVIISSASLWEIAIKQAIGKLELPGDAAIYLPRRIGEMGFETLAIEPSHALAVGTLPAHHADPFDRMLIAQAQLEHLTIVTSDRTFKKYSVRVVLN